MDDYCFSLALRFHVQNHFDPAAAAHTAHHRCHHMIGDVDDLGRPICESCRGCSGF